MCLAIPGKVISIDTIQSGTFRTGKVSFGGIIKEVNLSMVPDALVDDYVLVHVGVAISIILVFNLPNIIVLILWKICSLIK